MKIKDKIFEIFSSSPSSIFTADQIELSLKSFFPTITKNHFNLSDYANEKYSPGEVFLERVWRGLYQFIPGSTLWTSLSWLEGVKPQKFIKVKKTEVRLWTVSVKSDESEDTTFTVSTENSNYLTILKNSQVVKTAEDVSTSKDAEEFLNNFLLFSKDDLISLPEFLDRYQDCGIHDFNLEILFNYHKILDKYQSGRLYLYKDFFVLNDRGTRVYFLNENIKDTAYYALFIEALREKKIKRILSAVKLELEVLDLKKIREGIEDEVCSNLPETFDKNNYESGKKYNKKVTQALNLKSRVELRDITEADFDLVDSLNETWAKYKLEVVKVHGISFPRGRYKNSAKNLIRYKDFVKWKVFNKIVYVDWKPYGFTTYTIHWTNAYEHGYVSLYFDESFHIDNSLLKNFFFSELLKEWVEVVNSGFALNKNLRAFKTIHTKWSTYVNKYVYLTK